MFNVLIGYYSGFIVLIFNVLSAYQVCVEIAICITAWGNFVESYKKCSIAARGESHETE